MKNKKIKCSYPPCKKEGLCNHALNLINKKDSSISMPFCEYHYFIVIGGHFKARIIQESLNLLGEKKDYYFELVGPLQEVEIAEQVMGAREMVAALTERAKLEKLKSDDKKQGKV